MPLRAIISTLVILAGTLAVSAAPVTTAARNTRFQPRPTLNAAVLKPVQARILGGGQRAILPGQKTVPLWRAPIVNQRGPGAIIKLDQAAVSPADFKAAAGG